MNLDAVLFGDGYATYLLIGEWRSRGALRALQATVRLIDAEGYGTDDFRRSWRAAFPEADPMPSEKLADRDGRGTVALWEALP